MVCWYLNKNNNICLNIAKQDNIHMTLLQPIRKSKKLKRGIHKLLRRNPVSKGLCLQCFPLVYVTHQRGVTTHSFSELKANVKLCSIPRGKKCAWQKIRIKKKYPTSEEYKAVSQLNGCEKLSQVVQKIFKPYLMAKYCLLARTACRDILLTINA